MSALPVAVERPPPPPPRGWPVARVAGHLLMALWMAVLLGLFLYLIGAWRGDVIARYAPLYFAGLGYTLLLVVVSILCGAVLSAPIAFARMSSNRLLAGLAYGYVYLFRGTPLLAQTYLVYYGLGSFRPELQAVGLWWFFREGLYCALFAFSLNTAAYQAEILRGAIESVPRGQWEGGAALGLGRLRVLQKIILPQAMIVALRPYGNEIILMIKGSAVVALVTVPDLMFQTRLAYSKTFDIQAYLWAGVFYLALVECLRNVTERIEAVITRHLRR